MEALERLETCIYKLLSRDAAIIQDIGRVMADNERMQRDLATLAEENHRLHVRLAREESLRAEALRRVEALMRKIREHDSVE